MHEARARIDGEVVVGAYQDGTVRHGGVAYAVGTEAELLAPCEPSALYCVGRNYADTIDQMGYERPEAPDFFIKPPTSVLAPGTALSYPSFTDELVGAGELAAVIGERCRDVSTEAVPEVVRGYTVMNDLDAYDQPARTARKAFDGSAPLGPVVATDLDPTDLDVDVRIDGERDHAANTGAMLFDPFEVISFLSERLTLRPGDVVAFGSPTNVGPLEPGDVMEIDYEGIGTLATPIGERE